MSIRQIEGKARELASFEQFWNELLDESPLIQELRKESFEEGFPEGLLQSLEQGVPLRGQAEIQYLQTRLVNVVREKYPDLAEFAQQQANRFSKPDVLSGLISQVRSAPDASTAQITLEAKYVIQAEEQKKERLRMIESLAQTPREKCPVGTPKMTDKKISKWRKHIPDWKVASCDGVLQLTREYHFDNFSTALAFTNALGALAEREGHYPTLVTEWSTVRVDWWTPYIGGLHLNDFIMAAKTEVAYDEFVSEQDPPRGLVSFMQATYPSLEDIARQQACRFDTPEMLNLIIRQVLTALNVYAARKLLETGPEM